MRHFEFSKSRSFCTKRNRHHELQQKLSLLKPGQANPGIDDALGLLNREIFLRELISNASDALDKRRFEAIENKDLLPEDEELSIWLEASVDTRTLVIRDNGIGMSRDEVITNIGTIARSGTKEFLSALQDTKDAIGGPDLIGQFGVGFYSIFMVADEAELVTRRAGEVRDPLGFNR